MIANISGIMTRDPICVDPGLSVSATASIMRDNDIGAVVVTNDGHVTGIATDRDLVTRGLAEGINPVDTPVGNLTTPAATCLGEESSTADAVRQMREEGIRRLPVCDSTGRPVGIVSLGDLAEYMDPASALADISSAAPSP
ncbi:MAG TPA: CBS domain-containing protein [Stackebrandtia sp.]|jgi:CBS domain-containing protein|uniref:CBS domain-containing protein n=1 Tax=Stackebrandtia sp. TaxID=2023065 RepID=UPI002D62A084|nr:CBS domain-containing protein [Stackebrandtia sp.]HZE41506.1 CBS domain-containing protein [Stackebrandtia sp.]